MKSTPLCHALYMKDNREHMCMLLKNHGAECDGHETSRDLVPPEAHKMIIPFVGTIFCWESSQIPGVWLAYANPPHDVMSQGKPGAGHDSAIERLMRTIHATRLIEREYC
jgi:hypothetical protein